MIVTFRRVGRTCAWEALRPPRTRVPGPSMAVGADLPHDLATFVIEQTLGIEHGFWGCLADGATFRTVGRRRTPHGKAVIDRHADELAQAERTVNEIHFGWRADRSTPADAELDAMLDRWRELEEGGELQLAWQLAPQRAS